MRSANSRAEAWRQDFTNCLAASVAKTAPLCDAHYRAKRFITVPEPSRCNLHRLFITVIGSDRNLKIMFITKSISKLVRMIFRTSLNRDSATGPYNSERRRCRRKVRLALLAHLRHLVSSLDLGRNCCMLGSWYELEANSGDRVLNPPESLRGDFTTFIAGTNILTCPPLRSTEALGYECH